MFESFPLSLTFWKWPLLHVYAAVIYWWFSRGNHDIYTVAYIWWLFWKINKATFLSILKRSFFFFLWTSSNHPCQNCVFDWSKTMKTRVLISRWFLYDSQQKLRCAHTDSKNTWDNPTIYILHPNKFDTYLNNHRKVLPRLNIKTHLARNASFRIIKIKISHPIPNNLTKYSEIHLLKQSVRAPQLVKVLLILKITISLEIKWNNDKLNLSSFCCTITYIFYR